VGYHLLLASGALAVSTDDSDHSNDKLLRLLQDNQIDLAVVEGLRLVIAFKKIKDPSDRRTLIELAERFAK
jgi:molybdopterin-guanine dinucleotide biosynthesis protein